MGIFGKQPKIQENSDVTIEMLELPALPSEIWVQIFQFVKAHDLHLRRIDLKSVRQSCKSWKELIDNCNKLKLYKPPPPRKTYQIKERKERKCPCSIKCYRVGGLTFPFLSVLILFVGIGIGGIAWGAVLIKNTEKTNHNYHLASCLTLNCTSQFFDCGEDNTDACFRDILYVSVLDQGKQFANAYVEIDGPRMTMKQAQKTCDDFSKTTPFECYYCETCSDDPVVFTLRSVSVVGIILICFFAIWILICCCMLGCICGIIR